MKLQNKNAEINFFDRFEKEGGYEVFDETGYQKIMSQMKDMVKPIKGELILDLGCGSGAFTNRIAKAFGECKVVGMDISEGCIRRAKNDFGGITFKIGDAESTGLAANSVDIITYSGMLHHFPDFSKVAKEARRILKKGGRFFSYDPNYYNPPFWLYRCKESPFYSPVGVTLNERLITKNEIRRVFSDAGFNVKARAISGIKYDYVEGKSELALKIYNLLDGILGASPAAKLIGALVVASGSIKK